MRVQRDALFLPLTGLVALGFMALLLTSCQDKNPYSPFDKDPGVTTAITTKSWEAVQQPSQLPNPQDPSTWSGWEAPLLSGILQLGPWPPRNPSEEAILDTAWQSFTAFEGTRVGIAGIDSVLHRTGKIEAARSALSDAFGRFEQHFPGSAAPDIDFSYTGFNYSVYPTASLLLIGCEFFIGADHPSVTQLPPHIYPRYMQERMVPEHLIGDALRGWLLVHFQEEHYPKQGQLADELLYWGKVLFLSRCLAPDVQPWDLLDWTEEEWNWARQHEMQVWIELRQEEFLYTSKRMDIQRWVADAPFTKAGAVPQDSPDRLGWYLGMRWVEDFMARHPEMTLEQLMDQSNVLPFLQSYRPKG